MSSSPSPRAELKLVAAFALMPFASAVLGFAAYMLLFDFGRASASGFRTIDPIASAVAVGMGAGIAGVFVTVFGAVPLGSWLIRRGSLSLRKVLLLGAALGNAPLAVIFLGVVVSQLLRGTLSAEVGRLWTGWPAAIRQIGMGLVCGVGSAFVFWAVAVRGTELEQPRSAGHV